MEKPKNSEYTRGDFWHGRRIKRCVIKGVEIKDARVSDDEKNQEGFHICQNVVGVIDLDWFGLSAKDRFGYTFTFFMSGVNDPLLKEVGFYDEPPRSIREVQVGYVVVDEDGDEKHVLARLGNIVALSVLNKPHTVGNWYTFAELEGKGYRIKQEELQERETIEIEGKKYDKQEVENALKDLEEVE